MTPHEPAPPPDAPNASDAPPAPAPAAAAPRRRPRRAALAGLLGAAALAGALSLPLHAPGSRWLLNTAGPALGLTVEAPEGALLRGDFRAASLRLSLPGTQVLTLQDLAWQGLHWGWQAGRPTLAIERLGARRLRLEGEAPPDDTPLRLPASLALPLTVEVAALQLDTLELPGRLEPPLQDLRAQLALDRDGVHAVTLDRLHWERLQLSGRATLGSAAPLTLEAALVALPRPAEAGTPAPQPAPGDGPELPADWQLQLEARGPLAKLALQARLRAQDQALDARARLEPEAALPLTRLDARLQALDLHAFARAWPRTALHGELALALDPQPAGRAAEPLSLQARLRNSAAGAWDQGRLPVRELELDARSDLAAPDQGRVPTLRVALGSGEIGAGRIDASGQWQVVGQGRQRRIDLGVDARVDALQPQRLHAASPPLRIGGPLAWQLSLPWPAEDGGTTAAPDPAATAWSTTLRTRLSGQLIGTGLPTAVLGVELQADPSRLQVERLEAQAGGARFEGHGQLQRERGGAVALRWQSTLRDFDPASWLPHAPDAEQALGRLLAAGPHRLSGALDADLRLPAPAARGRAEALAWLKALRGNARLSLLPSRWAGVDLAGELALDATPQATSAQSQLRLKAELALGPATTGSSLDLAADLDPLGERDHWQLRWRSADLALLDGWLARISPQDPLRLVGRGEGELELHGRWPRVSSQGRILLPEFVLPGQARLAGLQARWSLGTGASDPVDIEGRIDEFAAAGWTLRRARLKTEGTGSAHRVQAAVEEMTQPRPARPARRDGTAAPPSTAPPAGNGNGNGGAGFVLAPLAAELATAGGWQLDLDAGRLDWQGRVERFALHELGAPERTDATSLLARPLRLELEPTEVSLHQAPERTALQVGATRASLGDLHLALQRLAWSQDRAPGAAPVDRLVLSSRLEAIEVAPILQRVQPGFGWGGDLRIGGHIELQADPQRFALDASIERERGDLRVTDPDNPRQPQRLGLDELRLALSAQDGRWQLVQRVRGGNLGRLDGSQSLLAPPAAMWPDAASRIDGQVALEVAQLGNWGRWLPAGWRLSGQLKGEARIAGRLGEPELSGELDGQRIAVRNLLLGVDWTDAALHARFDGNRARIETVSIRAGAGQVTGQGEWVLGEASRLTLDARAERFAALQRVDRRLVLSGQARLELDAAALRLNGALRADEGRFDFSQSDAPSLDDDVDVQRPEDAVERERKAAAGRSTRAQQIDLALDLGPALTLQGRGLSTRLAGELRLGSAAGRLALNGVIRAVGGNYAAYGQKLAVDRGLFTFTGDPVNPRLDVEATRTDLEEDVRVGVTVTGTAQAPRIRLFSVPSMSDTDKLSWLLLGRTSDGLGRTDISMLQQAAMAILTGEDSSPSLIERVGLDQLSVRQDESGTTRETIVTLGKQLGRRWFVGYERSLNAAAGNWQLIYRAARRFMLRAQSGSENALDLIWTWKWGEAPGSAGASGG